MNRHDILAIARFFREALRREARSRSKRYPDAAKQLHRFADQIDRMIEEIRTGPLFAERTGSEA
jgi:hypothetical protein